MPASPAPPRSHPALRPWKPLHQALRSFVRQSGYRCFRQGYEPWGFSLQSDLAKLGVAPEAVQTVLDVGANVGSWAVEAHNAFVQAEIHAFEPVPDTFERLAQNTGAFPRIHLWPCGISNQTGSAVMQVYDNCEVNSLETEKSLFGQPVRALPIPCTSLDRFATEQKLARVDMVKLDVEGHEVKAMEGALGLLKAERVEFLLVETKGVLASMINGPGVALETLSRFLNPLGYRLLVLYTDFINPGRLVLPDIAGTVAGGDYQADYQAAFGLPHTNFNALFGRDRRGLPLAETTHVSGWGQ